MLFDHPNHQSQRDYGVLIGLQLGDTAFDNVIQVADAATLCNALDYAYDNVLDDRRTCKPIEKELCTRFGFVSDDIEAISLGNEPESPAARTALGLNPVVAPVPDVPPAASQLPMSALTSEITLRDPKSLALHPCLDGMPELATDDAKFQGWLADIRDRGFDYPVIIDEQDRIIDGRHRRRIATMLGIQVPVTRRDAAEAVEIVLSALVHRRHYSKGALAYMAAPLFAEVVEAARLRRLAQLVPGAVHRKPTESVLEGSARQPTQSVIGKTVEQLAEELGFSMDLYTQARKVRELFADETEHDWPDIERPTTVRRYFEPQLLAAGIGLGGIIQACAGKFSTEGKAKVTPPVATLFERGLQSFTKRFELRWEKLTPADRQPIVRSVASEAAKWPEDVRQAVLSSLTAAAKHKPSDTGF